MNWTTKEVGEYVVSSDWSTTYPQQQFSLGNFSGQAFNPMGRHGFSIYEKINIIVTSLYFVFGFPTNLLSVIVCFKSLFEGTSHGCRSQKRAIKENFLLLESSNRANSGRQATNASNNATQQPKPRAFRRTSSLRKLSLILNQQDSHTSENSTKLTSKVANNTKLPSDPNGYTMILSDNADASKNEEKRMPFLIKKSRNMSNMNDFSSDLTNTTNTNTDSFSNKAFDISKTNQKVADMPKKILVARSKSNGIAKPEYYGPKHSLINGQPSIRSVSSLKVNSNPHRKCFELYLIEISFCDLLILAYNFMEVLLMLLVHYDLIDKMFSELVNISKFMCRFIIGFNRTITLLHNWLLASMAITRCYAIYKPLNSTAYYSVKFYYRLNLLVVFSLIVLFTLVNTYGAFLLDFYIQDSSVNSTGLAMLNQTDMMTPPARPVCDISPDLYNKYKYITVYINVTLGIFGYSVPCFITLFINLVLIYKIRHMLLLKTSKFRHNFAVRRSLKKNNRGAPLSQASEQESKSMLDSNDTTPRASIKVPKSPSSISALQVPSTFSWSSASNKNENVAKPPEVTTTPMNCRRKPIEKKSTEVYAMAKMKRYQFNQAKNMVNGPASDQGSQNGKSYEVVVLDQNQDFKFSKTKSLVDRKASQRNMNTRLKFFKTTSSLLTLSFAYLICYLPYSFMFLMISLNKMHLNVDLIFIFSMLRYLNHTLNFYIYYCTGKRFRNCVKQFLRLE